MITLNMEFDPYYHVEIKSNPDYINKSEEEEQNRQIKHLNYLSELGQKGILLLAGPFEGGGGIFLFDASKLSKDEVQDIIENDPHYIDNAAIYTTRKWFVQKNRMSFNLDSGSI